MRKDSQKNATVTRRVRRDLVARVAKIREGYVRIYNGGTVVPTHAVEVPPVVAAVEVPVEAAPATAHAVEVVQVGEQHRAVCSACGPLGTKPTGQSHAKAARTRHLATVAA